ncbi:uncharacterized protein LACBIDRAFT_310729 [Laccaria bicolor S238N-H82]|uniref:Predicted protein n=1 Tax=Laccaria bicolor (strain S238N-H82 / ATCC MYA-4686) TaxID=486041 RepID=B0DUZ5_LACBS|nr:uncharacterized protein LACBIDRAFT_310729 [Laccaria bicolor S238N-H82]EDR01700.1 predicted protein [Laccaria bicolor S238N-H82]|eukprot:XP_001887776.1 predicted protein [Laccaria bicolor S238N-H82]
MADQLPQQACEPKPRGKVAYAIDDGPSDEEMADDTRPAVNSPTASPPAKRMRREETSHGAAGSVQPQAGNYHGPRQQKAQDPRVAYQHQVGAPDNSGPEVSRTMNAHTRPLHPRPEHIDSGSEPVHNPRGTLHRPTTQDDAASDHAGGFRFRPPQAQYYNDVNMHDEDEHNAYMEDYHHPVRMDNQHLRLPPQFSGQHPRQYGPSGFGGRGRGGRSQYRAYAHPYEFSGSYGQGHEGFAGYGHQRLGRGPLESGDDSDRFSEGNPLRRQYPGEGHGF